MDENISCFKAGKTRLHKDNNYNVSIALTFLPLMCVFIGSRFRLHYSSIHIYSVSIVCFNHMFSVSIINIMRHNVLCRQGIASENIFYTLMNFLELTCLPNLTLPPAERNRRQPGQEFPHPHWHAEKVRHR